MKDQCRWMALEAKHGNTASAILLGAIFYQGELLPKDKDKALEWFKLAAEHNSSDGIKFRDLLLAEEKAMLGSKE